jgi:uncharacterized protein YkwD
MYRNLFLSLAVFAAFAAPCSAQELQTQNVKATFGLDVSYFVRPRLVPERREAAVASSTIINTLELERVAFDILNQIREENGMEALEWSERVAAVARVHSQNMAQFKFFGHRGLDNKLVSDRADEMKLGRWRAIGENIAYNRGYKDPVEKAVDNWLNSQSHRHNLLSSEWKESAVGVAVADDGSYYFTQVFLRK